MRVLLVAQSVSNPLDVTSFSPTGSSLQGFLRKEYWNGLPFPTTGNLFDPGIKPTFLVSLAQQADSLPLTPGKTPGEPS